MSKPKTFRSRSSDHVPVVPTMVGNGNAAGVKKIHVYRNADVFFQGIQMVVNTHRVPSVDVLLDVITERIGLINGAKKLYTTSGTLVKDINKIKDGQNYVASSSHFTPAAYGGQHQPIQKEVKLKKKKKKRSQTVQPRKTEHIELGDEISIPLNEPVVLEKKKKKKKKLVQKNLDLHGSIETLAETAEIELPSEIEDSEEEDEHEHRRSATPDHHRPATKHSVAPSRASSRRGSRRDEEKREEEDEERKKKDEKKRKSVSSSRRKSQAQHHGQPNWGDLSSFTKNIESLLKN
ncbi:Doublecortin domain-containing protein [Caenorhabditis elegans]|uniref:Doublecortin domain-containing protein n=1 Tax=Caenorhabditis elegans TaxID=6239 RepID=Q9XUK4_CAEEL|nr:Doublecortin domain-containing protein [Caenorhabditis elegans]CAB04933.2 Doublecortin domain-containing protein [Caenorhabditis elegans]|eukprot:NP_496917.2 Uncharacterized protein CELE_W07G1.1 [Caenorhabditis elegans]